MRAMACTCTHTNTNTHTINAEKTHYINESEGIRVVAQQIRALVLTDLGDRGRQI